LALREQMQAWAEELRGLATVGLLYATNDYDRERYTRLRRIAAELFAATDTREADDIERLYSGEIGYATPKVTAETAVFNEHGEVLLIRRADNGLWALPGGVLEVGEPAAVGAIREVREEAGVEVCIRRLLGITDSRHCRGLLANYHYHISFLGEPIGGTLATSHETTGVGYFPESALPPLLAGLAPRLTHAFRTWRGETQEAYFDPD